MTEFVKDRYQGILIPDPRFGLDNLTSSTHATAPSSYSQVTAKPGIPEAQQSTRMVLQTSGGQSANGSVEVMSARAGHPGLERAGYLWSDEAAESDKYGWDGPQLLSGWETLFWSDDASELSAYPDVIRLQSGKLLALGLQHKTTFAQTVSIYDPATTPGSGWSTAGTLTPDSATAQKGPALCQLPSGRVLAYMASGDQVDVYFSDDDGANWEPYSFRCLDTKISNDDIRQMRAIYSGGEVLLVIQFEDGASKSNCAQYASDDLGGRFTQVEDDWVTNGSEEVLAINLVEVDGAFLLTYHSDPAAGSNKYLSRRIGSAYDRLLLATAVDIYNGMVSVTKPGCASWRDDSGVVFALVSRDVSDDDLHPVRSDDGGDTWSTFSEAAYFSGDTAEARLDTYAAASSAGQVVVLSRWTADSSDEDPQSLGVVYLGGFSTHTGPAAHGTVSFQDTDYVAFNKNTSTSTGGGGYLPIVDPRRVGWTASGAGADDLASSVLKIDTTANTRYFFREFSSGNEQEDVFAEIGVSVDAGSGSLTDTDVGFLIRISDASSFKYEIAVCIADSGWALRDITAGAQIGSAITEDMTKRLHIRIAMDKGNVKTWYARRDQFREWTEGPGGAVSDAGANADNSRVTFGNHKTGSDVSRWGYVGYCFWPGRWAPTSAGFADSWSTPGDLHPRSFSTQPSEIFDNVKIAAVAGPTRYKERWQIDADYSHPLRNVFPSVAQSPRAAWRSKDATEQIIAWDISELAYGHLENHSFGVVLLGINFKTAYLEKYAAGWTTLCTINAAEGFTSLRFERKGETVYPETGGGAHKAGRYIMYQELEGGTFVDATNTKYRKIEKNSEGAWTEEAAKHPTIFLEGADDTEATSGDCEIWAPSAAGIAHSQSPTARYYRLRIPAQTTADGYFEIGQALIGPLAIFGTQYARGRQVVTRANSEIFTLPNGSSAASRMGPAAREVEFSWTDGVDATQINKDDPVPDYVAASAAGGGIASVKDSIYLMDGLLRRQGGAVSPVVYFARIAPESTDDQTNNPRHYIYGRITSDHSRQNILGDEEKTDVDRLGTITISEIV